jgi:hypothetical protein
VKQVRDSAGRYVSMKGIAAMSAKLRALNTALPKEVERALFQEASVEQKEVRRRTPVDLGDLRRSIAVVGPTRAGKVVFVKIVAGGPAAPYAIYVHENLTAYHKVGQAKFLESVIMESRPYMAARVAKRIDLNRALKG